MRYELIEQLSGRGFVYRTDGTIADEVDYELEVYGQRADASSKDGPASVPVAARIEGRVTGPNINALWGEQASLVLEIRDGRLLDFVLGPNGTISPTGDRFRQK